jgi:ADP-ribose pyrophosphatase YjhB (NUDIX family)
LSRSSPARDGEEIAVSDEQDDWLLSWHPPIAPPNGTPDGAAGVCVTGDGMVVLVSPDGVRWSLPGGRPEGDETWEETLHREMLEEACAIVTHARLLGFCRSACIAGRKAGVITVGSLWRAEIELASWLPQFEIAQRRLVSAADIITNITPDRYTRITRRILSEAGVA